MDRSEALNIVHEYVKNENLVRHMLAVEAAMRFYARNTIKIKYRTGMLA
jgi:predicted hydrolase (HD superfamily)